MLRAQLPVDWKAIEEHLPQLWHTWDPNGDGYIEAHELLGDGGLLNYVQANFPQADTYEQIHGEANVVRVVRKKSKEEGNNPSTC